MGHSVSVASCAACLLSLLLIATSAGAAATPEVAAPRLREARVEVTPPTRGHGRYRVAASLSPAPSPALKGDAGAVTFIARLGAKGLPMCPVPGALFSDGFESP